MDTASAFKKQAAEKAVEFVKDGMIIGLGHGSTAVFAIRRIAELLNNGKLRDVYSIPCSTQVEKEARKLSIPLTSFEKNTFLDITIDGADEVSPECNIIKGHGGALLREKIIAQASHREIIVVDETKLTPVLGSVMPLPIEVISFGWQSQARYLESLGARPFLRRNEGGQEFTTDQGNYILDCDFGTIKDPAELAFQLDTRAGIVEHGLFIGLATDIIIAGKEGICHLQPRLQSTS